MIEIVAMTFTAYCSSVSVQVFLSTSRVTRCVQRGSSMASCDGLFVRVRALSNVVASVRLMYCS